MLGKRFVKKDDIIWLCQAAFILKDKVRYIRRLFTSSGSNRLEWYVIHNHSHVELLPELNVQSFHVNDIKWLEDQLNARKNVMSHKCRVLLSIHFIFISITTTMKRLHGVFPSRINHVLFLYMTFCLQDKMPYTKTTHD